MSASDTTVPETGANRRVSDSSFSAVRSAASAPSTAACADATPAARESADSADPDPDEPPAADPPAEDPPAADPPAEPAEEPPAEEPELRVEDPRDDDPAPPPLRGGSEAAALAEVEAELELAWLCRFSALASWSSAAARFSCAWSTVSWAAVGSSVARSWPASTC